MLPPPAPMVSISTVWVRSGCRATDTSDLNSGRPGSTAMSDDVPPVSKVMMLSMPLMSPQWRPPMKSVAPLVDPCAGQKHFGRRRENVEHLVAAPLPADLVDVAKAACGDQADACALAFEHGVERRGRAVQDQRHRLGAELGGKIAGDLLHHRGGLRRVGRVFAHGDQSRRILVEGGHGGKGAADVDADTQFHEAALFMKLSWLAALRWRQRPR